MGRTHDRLTDLVRRAHHADVRVIGERVATTESIAFALDLGVDMLQGPMFERHPDGTGRDFSAGEIQCLTLVRQLSAESPSHDDVVHTVESDPELTMRVLHMVNSSASGVRRHIDSVRHAVVLLGPRQLTALAMASLVDARPTTVGALWSVLARALTCGVLADSDAGYTVGLLSAVAAAGAPVRRLPGRALRGVRADRRHALRDQTGVYGPVLAAVLAHEENDLEAVAATGLDPQDVARIYLAAVPEAYSTASAARRRRPTDASARRTRLLACRPRSPPCCTPPAPRRPRSPSTSAASCSRAPACGCWRSLVGVVLALTGEVEWDGVWVCATGAVLGLVGVDWARRHRPDDAGLATRRPRASSTRRAPTADADRSAGLAAVVAARPAALWVSSAALVVEHRADHQLRRTLGRHQHDLDRVPRRPPPTGLRQTRRQTGRVHGADHRVRALPRHPPVHRRAVDVQLLVLPPGRRGVARAARRPPPGTGLLDRARPSTCTRRQLGGQRQVEQRRRAPRRARAEPAPSRRRRCAATTWAASATAASSACTTATCAGATSAGIRSAGPRLRVGVRPCRRGGDPPPDRDGRAHVDRCTGGAQRVEHLHPRVGTAARRTSRPRRAPAAPRRRARASTLRDGRQHVPERGSARRRPRRHRSRRCPRGRRARARAATTRCTTARAARARRAPARAAPRRSAGRAGEPREHRRASASGRRPRRGPPPRRRRPRTPPHRARRHRCVEVVRPAVERLRGQARVVRRRPGRPRSTGRSATTSGTCTRTRSSRTPAATSAAAPHRSTASSVTGAEHAGVEQVRAPAEPGRTRPCAGVGSPSAAGSVSSPSHGARSTPGPRRRPSRARRARRRRARPRGPRRSPRRPARGRRRRPGPGPPAARPGARAARHASGASAPEPREQRVRRGRVDDAQPPPPSVAQRLGAHGRDLRRRRAAPAPRAAHHPTVGQRHRQRPERLARPRRRRPSVAERVVQLGPGRRRRPRAAPRPRRRGCAPPPRAPAPAPPGPAGTTTSPAIRRPSAATARAWSPAPSASTARSTARGRARRSAPAAGRRPPRRPRRPAQERRARQPVDDAGAAARRPERPPASPVGTSASGSRAGQPPARAPAARRRRRRARARRPSADRRATCRRVGSSGQGRDEQRGHACTARRSASGRARPRGQQRAGPRARHRPRHPPRAARCAPRPAGRRAASSGSSPSRRRDDPALARRPRTVAPGASEVSSSTTISTSPGRASSSGSPTSRAAPGPRRPRPRRAAAGPRRCRSPSGGRPVGGEREPQRRQRAVAATDLLGERRDVRGRLARAAPRCPRAENRTPPGRRQHATPRRRPPAPRRSRPRTGRPRRAPRVVPLRRRAHRRERRDARRRRAGAPVFAATSTVVPSSVSRQAQQQPPGHPGAGRRRRRRSAPARRGRGRGSSRGRGPPRCWRPRAAAPGRRATPPGRPRAGRPSRRRRRSRLRVGAGGGLVRGTSAGRRRWPASAASSAAVAASAISTRRRSSATGASAGLRCDVVGTRRRRRRRPRRRPSAVAAASPSASSAAGRRPGRRRVAAVSCGAALAARARPAPGCARRSAGRRPASRSAAASTSVSECAPQPWSTLTTLPSSGDHSLAQTPKTVPSEPCSGTRNPQLPHAAADASDPALVGPCGPRYQRSAASSRPCGDSTRTRARASSSIATSSSSGSPVGVQPGSRRGSSAWNGRTSPGPMSPGRSRSDHGSHAGPRTASAPGSSSTSQTVAVRPRGTRATVTVHSQPR